MSNYTKSTNFATKDNLTPGDPLKVVRGTEIDTEYNNIATAIATKTDNSAAAITGGSITGITDLAIADGGTGASTATAAINNLLPSQTSNANKYLQTDGTNASWDAVTLSTADITGTLAIANGGTGTTSTTFVNAATNVTGTLPVANGGTGVTSSTGTGNVVLSNSPTLVTPALGTPASGVATNLTGLPLSTGITGLGTGVATALAINTPNIGAMVVNGGALGTPSSGTVTNLTGTASININGTVGATTASTGAFTTLSATGVTTVQAGSAAAPAITTTGDTNTGIFFPAADTIAFSEGGAETMRIDSSGNVGIGNTPAFKLDVTGNIRTSQGVMVKGSNLTAAASQVTLDQLNTTTSRLVSWGADTSTAGILYLGTLSSNATVGTASALVINASQNVGIGITSPVVRLQSNIATSGTPATSGTTQTNGSFRISANAVTGGVLDFGPNGTNPWIQATDSGDLSQTYNILLNPRGGNVGIGVTSPAYKLQVSDNGNFNTTVNVSNTTAGTTSYARFLAISDGGNAAFGMTSTTYTDVSSASDALLINASGASGGMVFAHDGVSRMNLTSAGNLGLGVTPSAWGGGYKGLQVSGQIFTGTSTQALQTQNTYYDGVNFRYIATAPANFLEITGGQYRWNIAASGTAGAIPSFTQAMTLDASGNLMVGVTASTSRLSIAGSSNDAWAGSSSEGLALNGVTTGISTITTYLDTSSLRIGAGVSQKTGILITGQTSGDGSTVQFRTGNSERARIDSSGNLGLGVTPSAWQSGTTVFQMNAASLWARGATNGTELVTNGYFNGTSFIYTNTGTAIRYRQGSGAHEWYSAPSGTAGNAISFTQAMTLSAAGNLLVGVTTLISGSERFALSSSSSDWTQYTQNTNATPYGLRITYSAASPNGTGSEFLYCSDNGPTLRASIRSNGGIANYSANNVNLSDVRTKTDIQDAGGYLAKICAIPVRTFKYKDQTDGLLNLGVIAQEVEAVAPELVDISGFGETPDDGVPLKAIYQTDLQYALMKAIQELKAEFDAYKASHP